MLAFEPPRFGAGGTLGGAVASGLSGPRRPFTGAVRDYVLGVRVLNGRGEVLRFGGTVFKNVAGFDAFRLMAGAHGTLGVLLDVSLRVVPRPAVEAALTLDLPGEEARRRVADLMRHPLPLSGAFHDGERLHMRLSGGRAGVEAAKARIGGEAADPSGWAAIRDLSHPVLAGTEGLWRIALPRTGPAGGFEDLPWDQAGESSPMARARASAKRERVLHLPHTPQGESYVNIELVPLHDARGEQAYFIEKMEPLRVAQGQPAPEAGNPDQHHRKKDPDPPL
jgi:glycolate oxidase FAD binding subunit